MREIRPYGSAGGGTELNQSSLPRSSGTLRVLWAGPRPTTRSVEDGIPTEDRGNEDAPHAQRGGDQRGLSNYS
jgi:hypothetical protein